MKRHLVLALAAGFLFAGCDAQTESEFEEAAQQTGEAAESMGEAAAGAAADAARATEEALGDLAAELDQVDLDADSQVAAAEFEQWWDEADPFAAWDDDGDDLLNETETAAAVDADAFAEWDADGDGFVSETEAADGLFARWDEDGSGSLDAEEWAARADARV